MDDDSDRSSEATQLEEDSTAEETKLHDGDDDREDFGAVSEDEEDDEETDDQRGSSALEASPMSDDEDSRSCRSVALVTDLSEVPVKYEMRRDELEHLKNQLQGSHQEALAIVIAQAAQAHSETRMKLPVLPILNLPSVNAASIHVAEANQKDASDLKSLSVSCSVKIPIDGYNWRKYGQKQVKNPEGSRSYYKCTYTECEAKKIESCDQYNSVTKIVYKGQHEHDPPKKVLGEIASTPKVLRRKSISPPGSNQYQSSGSVGGCGGSIQIMQMEAPPRKQRVKKSSLASPGLVLKPPKKPKYIVHAAGDIEISADGYRWRKYGQKMVKGNPHPRNYYKCTSAGCPVRKHTEKAVDGTPEIIITYKGDHDHDMPVPKKRQGPPKGLLITSASKKALRSNRSEPVWTHGSTEAPVKKTSEPARTLLSIGFEIKNC